MHVHRRPRAQDGRGRLQRQPHAQRIPVGDAAQHAARVIGDEPVLAHRIAELRAARFNAGEAVADLHALHRLNAHHRLGDVGIQLVEHRLAQAGNHPMRLHGHAGADGVTLLAQTVEESRHLARRLGIRAEEQIAADFVGIEAAGIGPHRPDLIHPADDADVMGGQELPGDGPGGHAHGRLAGAGPAATAPVPNAVFLVVGDVRVAGPELVLDVRIILAALVGVADQQRNRAARGLALEHAGENLHPVGLAPLRGVAALAGPAPIQVGLDVGFREFQPRRATVHDGRQRRAVRLAGGGDAKDLPEGGARQGRLSPPYSTPGSPAPMWKPPST